MFVMHARTPRGIVSDSGRPNLKQGFSALVEDGTRSGLCRQDRPTCELTDEGQALFGNISMAYRNSREAPGDKKVNASMTMRYLASSSAG